MTTFLQRLEKSGAGQALLAEERAATQAHRAQLAAELTQLREEHLVKIAPLIKSEGEAKAKLTRAEEAVQVARHAVAASQQGLGGVANAYDRRRLEIERELTATAPALIGEFIGVLRNVLDKIGHESINVPSGRGKPRPEDLKRLQEAVDLKNSRIARIQACIPEVDGLKLVALDDGQLAKTLNGFRKLLGE